jgi:hypothetical protein
MEVGKCQSADLCCDMDRIDAKPATGVPPPPAHFPAVRVDGIDQLVAGVRYPRRHRAVQQRRPQAHEDRLEVVTLGGVFAQACGVRPPAEDIHRCNQDLRLGVHG